MGDLQHLPLIRLEPLPERRRRPGFGAPPRRNYSVHGRDIATQTQTVIDSHQEAAARGPINPALIMRVTLDSHIAEEEWERAGLRVLSVDADRTLVLFASDDQLTQFMERIRAYTAGPAGDRANPPYLAFVSAIATVENLSARDHIGLSARESGFTEPTDFMEDQTYILDVSLWDIGRAEVETFIRRFEPWIGTEGGELVDRYLGNALFQIRVRGNGRLFRQILDLPEVAEIDFGPRVDVEAENVLDLGLDDIEIVRELDDAAPIIGVLDSGIVASPLLEAATAAARGIPQSLGDADVWGHGTKVAGRAVYGDCRVCADAGRFVPVNKIFSVKVVNDQGEFPDSKLVVNQMRESIGALAREHGVRIFNISLGDRTKVYTGGKPGGWAAILDELAREFDVLIIVSAGNCVLPAFDQAEEAVTGFPAYLLEERNRLLEPASAAIAVSVGSIAHGPGLPGDLFDAPSIQAITEAGDPSPFTRAGPGIRSAIKPEFVDYGGTGVLDAVAREFKTGHDLPAAGVIVPRHDYINGLLTAASGTSHASPAVAFKAARVLRAFPAASANLIRALLANAASKPERADNYVPETALRLFGYGLIDPERAVGSDESRVVLYAEEELEIDHFAVFEVPMPEIFRTERGRRTIRATLAFDPPVRQTRADYLGVTMNLRLIKGRSAQEVFDHFRRRGADEDAAEALGSSDCPLVPGKMQRDMGTLQSAELSMQRWYDRWGDTWYLVVRLAGGWAKDFVTRQRYAVVVEIAHEAEIPLHAQLAARVQARERARARR